MDESTPDQPSPADAPDDDRAASAEPVETDWQRKRRLAAVFGDVLPDTTSDEQDADPHEQSAEQREDVQDRWLRSQVPPHHG